ncbi:hypothetical protein Taro_040954 [Colocasia esculenta]|uniref:Transcription repressor n=1 Tax=Colocasia esculenta TaxID=4460 RepID=A0A843WKB3_COLES|nr:hypothetical protein [Colocasia esculenta]
MGRKMGFPSLFKASSGPPPSYCASYSVPSWPWPSCKHPRTQSFRAGGGPRDDVYKTVNSVYLDAAESWFTNSSEELASESLSTASEEEGSTGAGPSAEAVIRSLQSDGRGGGRLFFEPGATSSILEESKPGGFPFKDSVVMAMQSEDPYRDFRVSMEEVVTAHGVRDWDCLEELLDWYLRVNGKTTHGFIVGAFIDLLLELFSPSSSCSSPSSMSELDHADDEEDGKQRQAKRS